MPRFKKFCSPIKPGWKVKILTYTDKKPAGRFPAGFYIPYLISCSRLENSSLSKKSRTLRPRPSHNFFMVPMPALYVLPLIISLTVDWVMPEMLLRALMLKCLSRQSSSIRRITA
ncbi:hypothetical protein DSY0559 [Desulfitobacterium hafniense Y51]|uniref:Uncharacterized protein n=1 Tax=Desulfitobacterium hafniense (strain Y51) TaxID=138119 RepID=Q250E4_DESHY|nr:hypothetical protein DSY0559 [Desulfitobacterium hafniense Y51]